MRTILASVASVLAVMAGPCEPAEPPPPPPPLPGIVVPFESLPAPDPGSDVEVIVPANYSPTLSDGIGAFRVSCRMSHMNWADPIVAPGAFSHLHTFFGNTAVDSNSTAESIANSGNSTCTGGIANRTSYWVPTMIDTATNTPVTSFHDIGPHTGWQHRSAVHGSEGLQVYYKTGYQGVRSEDVQNFPQGLRMIAGTATRTSEAGDSGNLNAPWVSYDCVAISDTNGHTGQLSIPNCTEGQVLTMVVRFPQCWDGRNLDSPDHKSHMAYALGVLYPWPPGPAIWQGCPESHPVPLPEVTYNVRYVVPAGGTANWRLSSDVYSGPAGFSGHADWFNGWNEDVFQRVVNNCYASGLDCHMNLLGDGWMLG